MSNNLKDLRNRVKSVKSTAKITKAMKMVSAAKLKKSQEAFERIKPYNQEIRIQLSKILSNHQGDNIKLLNDSPKNKLCLIIMAGDRGLCGSFNNSLIKYAIKRINEYKEFGKEIKIITIGNKVQQALGKKYGSHIIKNYKNITKGQFDFSTSTNIVKYLLEEYENHNIDSCEIIYNIYHSPISQVPAEKLLFPLSDEMIQNLKELSNKHSKDQNEQKEFLLDVDQSDLLESLIVKFIRANFFKYVYESIVGEHSARMTAMDNATNNANDMLSDLTLQLNKTRQALITKELIEIISGAEAV